MDAASGSSTTSRSWTPAPRHFAIAVGAVNLAQAVRRYGHLAAQLDPLGSRPVGDPALLPATHGVTEEDLRRLPANLVSSPLCDGLSTMLEVVDTFRRLYCSTTGYDYAHVFVPEERQWLRQAAEGGRFRAPADPIDPLALLDRLTEVEVFERFLHRTFPGKTRFSIEGLDMLVPILDDVIAEAAEAGIRSILIGMAHRGRLNVMAHVLKKPYQQILAEFKDPVSSRNFREDMAWTGDVKYHAGAPSGNQGWPRDGSGGLDAAQPEPSRGRRSSRRRHGAGGGHADRKRRTTVLRPGAQRARFSFTATPPFPAKASSQRR